MRYVFFQLTWKVAHDFAQTDQNKTYINITKIVTSTSKNVAGTQTVTGVRLHVALISLH